ncbi:MAG: tripartite tricarboxylate transporter substrate binding protein [Burkholderiales bacterium]|nr:tripartite tricarboxylate transporter substrate binding protein [Burkholderiales bacterium]
MQHGAYGRRRFIRDHGRVALAAMLAQSAGVGAAWAQSDYPNRTIRMIVPFGAGSATDILTRHIEPSMSHTLGQKIVIDNRAGANGITGAQLVKPAAADGYTLCMGSTSSHSIVAAMRPNSMPYDIQADFSAIGLAAKSANLIAVHPSVPAKNLRELIEYSKTQPQGLSFASSPVGSSNNLAGEMLRLQGAKLVSVPYNNISQGVTDVLAGHVPILIYTVALLPYVREGRLRGIATLSERRLTQAPDLPTATEQGIPMVATAWFGMFGPAKLPAGVRDKLSSALRHAIDDQGVKQKLIEAGLEPEYLAPAQFETFIARDIALWKDVVQRAGVKTES